MGWTWPNRFQNVWFFSSYLQKPTVNEKTGCHPEGRSARRLCGPPVNAICYPNEHQESAEMNTLRKQSVFVAGHRGMVGSAVVRAMQDHGVEDVILRTRDELDLCNQSAVDQFFGQVRPEVVVFAAARVGGIHSNDTYSAEFIHQNLVMSTNAIHSAYVHGVKRFLFLGSTCIYPRMAPQPMPEDCLLTGELEPTNEAYAVAKIAGLKMCQHYRKQYGVIFHSAMPTNLYGPGDNYHPQNSHVLPALLRRFHEAKNQGLPSVTLWGSGKPRREFLHVDDLAQAVVHLLGLESPPNLVNVGTGTDVTIRELAGIIAETVSYNGDIQYDLSKPDGTPVKRTDIQLIESTGWQPTIDLRTGINRTYQDFLRESHANALREV